MRLSYMTNAFAPLVGTVGGVTSMKENGYLTDGDEEMLLQAVEDGGYKYFDIFEGNLTKYEDRRDEFKALMKNHGLELLGVYIGCHFIYPDALPDELAKVEKIVKLAKDFGATQIIFGGGSLRASGIRDEDYQLLAEGLDRAADIVRANGLTPTYHPHLGSLAETPEQIDKLFALTDIGFCPDTAHLVAGGGDALAIIKKYRDRVQYVHLKDLDADGNFVPLGKGTIPLLDIVDYLKSSDYNGDWCVEIDGYSGDPHEAAAISRDYLRNSL